MASKTGDWMGSPETADYLGVELRTLYRLVNEDHLPAYKIGRVIRFRQHEVDDFIAKSRVTNISSGARPKPSMAAVTEQVALLEEFIAAASARVDGPCPVCGEVLPPSDWPAHLRGHR